MDETKTEKIYRNYLRALKKCNQPTANVTMDKIERSLKKKSKAGGGNMDFKVVIKGGKASIKAVKTDSDRDS